MSRTTPYPYPLGPLCLFAVQVAAYCSSSLCLILFFYLCIQSLPLLFKTHLLSMDTKRVMTTPGFFLLILSPLESMDRMCERGLIVYTQDQLSATCSMLVLTCAWPDVPNKLRRMRRERHIHRPVSNKMQKLAMLTQHQRKYQQSSIMLQQRHG